MSDTAGNPAPPTQAQARPQRQAAPAMAAVAPPARPARTRRRHWMVLVSFAVMVLAPLAVAAWYLYTRAADQYASTVGFSVRKEEVSSAVELLGGITELSGSSSSDTDILYEFLQSQKLVATLNAKMDLAARWSKPENDPYFSYDPSGTIEDLLEHWQSKVKIYYDSGSGLIEIRVLAFDPQDATEIAQEIFNESSDMINELSAIAREDAVRYAREELEQAVERLKVARQAVTLFRNENQLVDPTVDIQTQAGLLGNLQAQLAEALIDLDLLSETTRDNDPRVLQTVRRVEVIEARIAEERRKLGISGGEAVSETVFASIIGNYESLIVDREFAEQSYTSALATYDAAVAEASRKSRYLAAYVLPTRAERAEYPQREELLALLGLFLFVVWAIATLVAYSLRDRR